MYRDIFAEVLGSQQHTKGYENRWFSKSQVLGTVKTRDCGAPAILVPVWVVLFFGTEKGIKTENGKFWGPSKLAILVHQQFGTRFHRVLQGEGAAQRGGSICFIFAVLWTLFSCIEMSLFSLKTCTPVKATPLKCPLAFGWFRGCGLVGTPTKWLSCSGHF